MTDAPTAHDWATLGIAPTADLDAVRRGYRERLRSTGPERDPEGFQALRQAYERLLAHLQQAQAGAPANGGTAPAEDAADAARAFVDRLGALRATGDGDAARAWAAQALGRHLPGSAALDAIEDLLLGEVALDTRLSPPLFRMLAARFDWHDIQGRAARMDAERHAAVLDRIAAEEWMEGLHDAAASGDRAVRVAALLVAPPGRAAALLSAAPLDADERQQVRRQFEALLAHAYFVLTRFDGATLALLREAVEGPPLVADAPPAPAPGPAGGPAIGMSLSPRRRLLVRAVAVVAAVGAVAGQLWWKQSRPEAARGTDTSLAEEVATPLLKDPRTPWLALREEPAGLYVDWAPVMRLRRAVAELRIGANVEEPATAMPLPALDAPIGFVAPRDILFLTMRVRYQDGTWSEVRRYPVWEGR